MYRSMIYFVLYQYWKLYGVGRGLTSQEIVGITMYSPLTAREVLAKAAIWGFALRNRTRGTTRTGKSGRPCQYYYRIGARGIRWLLRWNDRIPWENYGITIEQINGGIKASLQKRGYR